MIGTGPCGGFQVAGQNVKQIRSIADGFRNILQVGDHPEQVSVGHLLDGLWVQYRLNYEVCETEEMPHHSFEAFWVPETLTMHVRTDVFERACVGDPRSRFTIIHELGHCLLGHKRTINRAPPAVIETFEDSEWQANQFAAEFLMPLDTIRREGIRNIAALVTRFSVSQQAAGNRIRQLTKRREI